MRGPHPSHPGAAHAKMTTLIQPERTERVQSCKWIGGAQRKTLYINDSGSCCILMANVPVAAGQLYSHL